LASVEDHYFGIAFISRRCPTGYGSPRGNWQDDQPLIPAPPDATAINFRITFKDRMPPELAKSASHPQPASMTAMAGQAM